MKAAAAVTEGPIPLSLRSRFRAAMILAMTADALQIFVLPLFAEGASSPADDVLDLAVAAVLVHWESLPAFLTVLVPGVDLVPFWTLAVVNFIANGSRSRSSQKKLVSNARLYQSRTIGPSRRSDGGQDGGFQRGDLEPKSRIPIRART
jgi:hypothetical protein